MDTDQHHRYADRLCENVTVKCVPRKIKARASEPSKKGLATPATLKSEIEEVWHTLHIDEDEDALPADGRFLRLTEAQERDILRELHLGDETRPVAVAAVLPILGAYERERLTELNALPDRDEVRGADAALSAIRATIASLSSLGPNTTAALNANDVGEYDSVGALSEELSAAETVLMAFLARYEVKQGAPGYPALERAVHALADLYKHFTGKTPAFGGPFIRFCQSTLYPLEPGLRDLSAVEGMVKKVLRHRKKGGSETPLIS